jgi:hypothetical protein
MNWRWKYTPLSVLFRSHFAAQLDDWSWIEIKLHIFSAARNFNNVFQVTRNIVVLYYLKHSHDRLPSECLYNFHTRSLKTISTVVRSHQSYWSRIRTCSKVLTNPQLWQALVFLADSSTGGAAHSLSPSTGLNTLLILDNNRQCCSPAVLYSGKNPTPREQTRFPCVLNNSRCQSGS